MKQKAADLKWLPPAEEWDFRSVTPQECRVAAYWEYEREHAPVRIIQSGGAKSPNFPAEFRQPAREVFPQAWNTLSPEQRVKIVESFLPSPALQVRKLREFLKRMPANEAHPELLQRFLHQSYVIIPDFRVHGFEVVIAEFERWAREEAKNYPSARRAKAAELPFDTLKWLAVARVDVARCKASITIEKTRKALGAYQQLNRRPDANGVFPIYASDGAWLKARKSAHECQAKSAEDPSLLLAGLAR
jgi:hypothetical protein